MDVVVDANVLFAALIKQSITEELLFANCLHLYAPEFILVEFEKHKEEILQKTERTTQEFYTLLEVFRRRITFVPLDDLVAYLEQAEQISPDPKDVTYIALALKLHISVWSNDKDFKKQNKVKVYTTEEIMKFVHS